MALRASRYLVTDRRDPHTGRFRRVPGCLHRQLVPVCIAASAVAMPHQDRQRAPRNVQGAQRTCPSPSSLGMRSIGTGPTRRQFTNERTTHRLPTTFRGRRRLASSCADALDQLLGTSCPRESLTEFYLDRFTAANRMRIITMTDITAATATADEVTLTCPTADRRRLQSFALWTWRFSVPIRPQMPALIRARRRSPEHM